MRDSLINMLGFALSQGFDLVNFLEAHLLFNFLKMSKT